jgi:hypothetical protein
VPGVNTDQSRPKLHILAVIITNGWIDNGLLPICLSRCIVEVCWRVDGREERVVSSHQHEHPNSETPGYFLCWSTVEHQVLDNSSSDLQANFVFLSFCFRRGVFLGIIACSYFVVLSTPKNFRSSVLLSFIPFMPRVLDGWRELLILRRYSIH